MKRKFYLAHPLLYLWHLLPRSNPSSMIPMSFFFWLLPISEQYDYDSSWFINFRCYLLSPQHESWKLILHYPYSSVILLLVGIIILLFLNFNSDFSFLALKISNISSIGYCFKLIDLIILSNRFSSLSLYNQFFSLYLNKKL